MAKVSMETSSLAEFASSLAADAWALDPAVAMLNHGSFGACPRPVLQRQAELRREMEAEPVRFLNRRMPPLLDQSRRSLAATVGGEPENLVFVANATAGVNAVLRSLRFQPGEELLVTNHGYNACNNVVRWAAERDGAAMVVVDLPIPIDSPKQIVEAVLARTTPRTRLALLDHITSPTAVVFPIESLVRRLAERGVDVLVDGAHAPGMVPLDLRRLGAATTPAIATSGSARPRGRASSMSAPTGKTASSRRSSATATTSPAPATRGSKTPSTGKARSIPPPGCASMRQSASSREFFPRASRG